MLLGEADQISISNVVLGREELPTIDSQATYGPKKTLQTSAQ
jgi:hypothetical protein